MCLSSYLRVMKNSALLCICKMICMYCTRLLEHLQPKIHRLLDDCFCVATYELQLSLNIDSI